MAGRLIVNEIGTLNTPTSWIQAGKSPHVCWQALSWEMRESSNEMDSGGNIPTCLLAELPFSWEMRDYSYEMARTKMSGLSTHHRPEPAAIMSRRQSQHLRGIDGVLSARIVA